MRSFEPWAIFGCWFFVLGLSVPPIQAQGAEVSGRIVLASPAQPAGKKHHNPPYAANVVVWLSPLKPGVVSPIVQARQPIYRLVQRGKMFTPHLLVVPTGSQVEFPNQDPFFHNVFSLFNGKRFDLGLYESGTSRSVRFDREGVSYIFCNIHPEMGAIVLALSTPYYAISGENGVVTIHNVPPGSYRLSVWSESGQLATATASQKTLQVASNAVNLGDITLQAATDLLINHKNKFGEDYEPSHSPKY